MERKLSMSLISDALSIKSVFLRAFSEDGLSVNADKMNDANRLPLPILVSPPSPGLEPKSGNSLSIDDYHLSPSTTPIRRRSRSRDSTLSRSPRLDGSGVGGGGGEVGAIDFVVINTIISPKQMDAPMYGSSPKELDASSFLSIPTPQGGHNIPQGRQGGHITSQGNSTLSGSDDDPINNDKGSSRSESSESDTPKICPPGRHLTTSSPSLVSRTSFSRRKPLPSPPTIVITPAITDNDNATNDNNLSVDPHDTHSLSIQSVYSNSVHTPPSPIFSIYEDIHSSAQKNGIISIEISSNSNSNSNNNSHKIGEIFRAFPGLPTRYRLKLAIASECIIIILVGGVLIYDFVYLALGQNVFD